ncbi:MAG: DNA methyltransferase, partial [Microcystaceae cyanobacterium]
ITMYMCRETIRRAVIQKFNEVKGWHCESLTDLYNEIRDKKEANQIINGLKICDPAVGSGHFLVSALNEMIVIKSELRILMDRSGKLLRDYGIEVANDELSITYGEGDVTVFFEYNPASQESQRVQETLFHEKQTIIENCLFGVDINENSVKICQLRLWIELLKNAYYRADGQLETLPNIDINIKRGNSLISRFPLDSDLTGALRKAGSDVATFRGAVRQYHHALSRVERRELLGLMARIKEGFRTTLFGTDPNKAKLRQLEGELFSLQNQTVLFAESKAEARAREKKATKLQNEIDKLRAAIEEVESGRLYENA